MPDLLVDRHGSTAVLTLSRPDRLNAISAPMLRDLSRALLEAGRDPDVRCIVLTGAGRGFRAGLGLEDEAGGGGLSGSGAGGLPGELDVREAPPVVLHGVDTPTVCALNGGAARYGMEPGARVRHPGGAGRLRVPRAPGPGVPRPVATHRETPAR